MSNPNKRAWTESAINDELKKVTRLEVIDHTTGFEDARAYHKRQDNLNVELSIQDEGRTLKVFLSNKVSSTPEPTKEEPINDQTVFATRTDLCSKTSPTEVPEIDQITQHDFNARSEEALAIINQLIRRVNTLTQREQEDK